MPDIIETPHVVTRAQWLEARTALLAQEKALTRMRDAVSAERRALPWVKVEKEYVFDTPAGPRTLADLFEGRSQLITYHFMWRREFGEGCVGCSFLSDHVDGPNQHLAQHDVSFVAVARAPLASLTDFKKRMGWRFNMASSLGSDFNFDYHVSFTPEQLATGEVVYNFGAVPASIEELSGISVFYRPEGRDIFHTYSSYARGNEEILGAYMWLDLTPRGRNENGPNFTMGDWVRHHDRYGKGGHVDASGAYIAPASTESPCCCKSDA
ncbi:MAG: thioredoxin family protein [Terracidiphilus sp.]